MKTSAFRALLIEDNPADAFYVKKLLSYSDGPAAHFGVYALTTVSTLEQAEAGLAAESYDVVLLDLTLPDSHGLDTLRAVQKSAKKAPLVVLTGLSDTNTALQALTLGAQDFLAKDGLGAELVARTLRYAIERRRAQEQLLAALREKEVLLRELHHRAKNNLQVISSLLGMQARRSDDARFRALVAAAQERVDSIALAHEKLHSSPDLGRIDFSAYLSTLAHAIHRSYDGDGRGIELALHAGAHELPLDLAVSAGLIANELLTNALKHAFPGDRQGKIVVSLAEDAAELALTVEDDGVGLRNNATLRPHSLGLELVATLAEQLSARLEQERGPGTRFRLSFCPRSES